MDGQQQQHGGPPVGPAGQWMQPPPGAYPFPLGYFWQQPGIPPHAFHPPLPVPEQDPGPSASSSSHEPRKRGWYWDDMGVSDSESDESDEESFDPESYYDQLQDDQGVAKLISKAFRNCLTKTNRKRLCKEFPRPNIPSAQVPKADHVLFDFLGSSFPKKRDEQLARVQTAVIASSAPIASLLSSLEEQGFKGAADELIPVSAVNRACKASLKIMLVGNATQYISHQRRENIISALPSSKANLGKILRQVCRSDTKMDEKETCLFGTKLLEEVSERVTLLTPSRRLLLRLIIIKSKRRTVFWGKGPASGYGSGWDQSSSSPYHQSDRQPNFRKKVF